jgi:hypothetical protein
MQQMLSKKQKRNAMMIDAHTPSHTDRSGDDAKENEEKGLLTHTKAFSHRPRAGLHCRTVGQSP